MGGAMKKIFAGFLLVIFICATHAYSDDAKLKEYQIAVKAGDLGKANIVQRTMNDEDKVISRKFYQGWKKQQEIDKKKAHAEHVKKMLPARKAFAKGYEQEMLGKGLDVYASTHGKDHTTFKIKYILTNRPLVHKLINNSEFTGNLKGLGFKKLIMTDGYRDTWTIDL